MRNRIFVVDSFAERPFAGNPAGVCLLQHAATDEWMQSVASEMRHAETAFIRFTGEHHELRWFTPKTEVDLCGHATLAAAHILWTEDLHSKWQPIQFHTKSGILTARLEGQDAILDFPSEAPESEHAPSNIEMLLGTDPQWFGKNRMDWMAVLDSEEQVRGFQPNFDLIEGMGMRGLIITAKSHGDFDFVSRFFAPQCGVPEDPVTGSAHCCLGPYWGDRLGKMDLLGFQASARGGAVGVRLRGERVELVGKAVTILEGRLHC